MKSKAGVFKCVIFFYVFSCLQIFYKGMLDYLSQDTAYQILPRLDDLLQINGKSRQFKQTLFNSKVRIGLKAFLVDCFNQSCFVIHSLLFT